MKKVNPAYIEAVIKMANNGPYLSLLDMKICELDYGYCRLETQLSEKLNNPFGSLHGGVFSSILDTATFWALYCSIEDGSGIITLDLQINNLAAINTGKIIAEGKQIKLGRTIGLAEATLKDESGKLLAYGTSKMLVSQGLQSIDKIVNKAGIETLPVKFL